MVNVETRRRALWNTVRKGALTSIALGVATALPAGADPGGEASLTNFAVLRETALRAVTEMLADEPGTSREPIVVVPGMDHPHNWVIGELIGAELTRRGHRVHVIDAPLDEPSTRAPVADGPDTTGGSAGADTTALPPSGNDDTAAMLEHLQGLEGAISTGGAPAGEARPTAARPANAQPPGDVLEFRLGLSEVKYIDESRAFLLGPKRVQRGAAVQVTCRLEDGETGELLWVGEGASTFVDAVPKSKLAVFESEGFAPARVTGRGIMRIVEPVVVGGIVAGLVVLFYTNQN